MSRGFWLAVLAGCAVDFVVGLAAFYLLGDQREVLAIWLGIFAGMVAMLIAGYIYDRCVPRWPR